MKVYITILEIDTHNEQKREYKVYNNEAAAMTYVEELSEKYAPLAEYARWECHEEWNDAETRKIEFEYYDTGDTNQVEQSIHCRMVEGSHDENEG